MYFRFRRETSPRRSIWTYIFTWHLLLITNLLQDYNLNTHKPLTDVLNIWANSETVNSAWVRLSCLTWLSSGQANGLAPYRKKWLPSWTSNQPESLRRVWVSVCFSLSYPSTLCQTVSSAVEGKKKRRQKTTTGQQLISCFDTTSASTAASVPFFNPTRS